MDKIKILLDTDLGSDCDDAGALAVLHRLADAGRAEILGISHCTSEIGAAITIKAINDWYKRGNLPIGRYDIKPFMEGEICKKYSKVIMEEYLKNKEIPEFENSIRVMRRILSENDNVTLVTIGSFNNVAELLRSQPDDISELSGTELVEKSVKEVYSMAGNFADLSYAEYNVRIDCDSAVYVAENMSCPIIYCGFELGNTVRTGANLSKEENNPVEKIYKIYNDEALRESWDPITVYCAIEKNNEYFEKSNGKHIMFNSDSTIKCEDGGKDFYMIKKKSDEEIVAEIDRWMY